MSWRTAFLSQARSDNEVRVLLNRSLCPYAHQLHYLQMTAEKLAKGYMTPYNAAEPPEFSHAAFVRCLQVIKGRPEIRRLLGYRDTATFVAYIDAILPLADRVQRLAPTYAGKTQPNPEYPWQPTPAHDVVAPCDFDFPDLGSQNIDVVRLVTLMEGLLRVTT